MESIKSLDVALMATGCSVRCRHCYASARQRVEHPIGPALAEEILDRLQPLVDRAEQTLVDVYYDLFDHPDAPAMVRLLHRRNLYGFFQDIATNGRGLARRAGYRELLKEMREMGSKCLQLALHGLEENHDWFVRRKGAFKDLLVAAEAGRQAGLDVLLCVDASKRNVDELPALADYLAARGLWIAPEVPFAIFTWSPAGYAAELENLRIDLDDAEAIRARFKRGVLPGFRPERDWWKLAVERQHDGFPWGSPGAVHPNVWGDYSVTFGYARHEMLGNLKEDSLEAIISAHGRAGDRDPARMIRQSIWDDGVSERLVALAERYGNPEGKKLYRTGANAMSIWLERERQDTQG